MVACLGSLGPTKCSLIIKFRHNLKTIQHTSSQKQTTNMTEKQINISFVHHQQQKHATLTQPVNFSFEIFKTIKLNAAKQRDRQISRIKHKFKHQIFYTGYLWKGFLSSIFQRTRDKNFSQTLHKVILSAHLHILFFTPSIHNLFYLQAHVALLIALPSAALAR